MTAEIITIGDEILIGQVIDTNSAFIAQQLNLSGIAVKQISSVSDNKEHILKALDEAAQRAQLILITGGLGPTKDDITKHTLSQYFNSGWRLDEEVLKHVEFLFNSRGLQVTPINRKQAEVPDNCTVIVNANGTAPGMWFEKDLKVFVSMPGVPYEMKAMMLNEVIPRLKIKFKLPVIVHKTILTQGIGESFLADLIEDWENSLALHAIKLAYLPSPGMVRLRLSLSGTDEKQLNEVVDAKIRELQSLISQYIYGYETYGEEPPTLGTIIGKLLRKQHKTLATAESCTGGYIAHLITKVAGSSDYYKGSVVSYTNDIKVLELGIKEANIINYGAVSSQVVEAMAAGIKHKFNTDYAIATSGIAGPTGGTAELPVGTIWIAVATANGVFSEKFLFGNNRERNIERASLAALNMLRKAIEN